MSDAGVPFTPIERVVSNVPGLDVALGGGLLRGGLYLISGYAGTGKTTLANQLAFNHVRAGGRVAYISLLSESHSRLFVHLQAHSFFDPALIGDALQYFSAYSVVDSDGLEGLTRLLRQTIRQHRATLVIMDGFETVKHLADEPLVLKRFMHQLQVSIELLGSTMVILSQPALNPQSPERTMADGLIDLHNESSGLRRARELEISKLRGSNHLHGRHPFEITDDGVVVHPRTEVLFRELPPIQAERERLSMGVPQLDQMLHGGVLHGSSTLLLGAPGTGKTLLGLHFLATGARDGEQGLYFGLFEQPARLIRKADSVGMSFSQYIDQGLLELAWQWPREDILDVYAERLLAAVRRRNVRRVLFDGVDGLQHVVNPDRIPIFLAALIDELTARGVTVMCTAGLAQVIGPQIELPPHEITGVVDNIILLRYVELRSQLYRLISLLKVRDSDYDTAIREFSISNQGVKVANTFDTAEAILTGIARPAQTTPPPQPRRRAQQRTDDVDHAAGKA